MTISKMLSSKCHETKEKMILSLWNIQLSAFPLALRDWHKHGTSTAAQVHSSCPAALHHLAEEGPVGAHFNHYTLTISWNPSGLRLSPVSRAPQKRALTKRGRWSYISCPSLESGFVMQSAEFKTRPMDTWKQSEPNGFNKAQVLTQCTEC